MFSWPFQTFSRASSFLFFADFHVKKVLPFFYRITVVNASDLIDENGLKSFVNAAYSSFVWRTLSAQPRAGNQLMVGRRDFSFHQLFGAILYPSPLTYGIYYVRSDATLRPFFGDKRKLYTRTYYRVRRCTALSPPFYESSF